MRLNGFHWLTLALITALVVPVLIQDSMFIDGLQYACVSKNLANGQGTFWHPYVNATWMKAGSNDFLEHPPLVYGIQSLFFHLFGNSIYTERIYSFFTCLASAFFIAKIFRLIVPDQEKNMTWLPVALWIITPVAYWAYQNNIQENTTGIFCLASVYFVIRSQSAEKKNAYLFLSLAAATSFAALLCKGVPAAFTLIVLPVYFLCFSLRNWKRFFLQYSFFLGTLALLSWSIIYLNPAAYDSMRFYITDRLLQRVHDEPTVSSRWFILLQLGLELVWMIGVALILFLVRRKHLGMNEQKPFILFFLLIGLSASLPLLLTLVQRGFYLVPSIPYFALALSVWLAPMISGWSDRIRTKKHFALSGAIVFAMVMSLSVIVFSPRTSRDHAYLHDVYLMGPQLERGEIVNGSQDLYNTWQLHFYLTRHYDVSVQAGKENAQHWIIKKQETPPNDSMWNQVPLKTQELRLFERK